MSCATGIVWHWQWLMSDCRCEQCEANSTRTQPLSRACPQLNGDGKPCSEPGSKGTEVEKL
jgi:hypothetical protein